MGKLYGSEYWTYLLPKRVGATKARELTEPCLPIRPGPAQQFGLMDAAFEEDAASFRQRIRRLAEELANSDLYEYMLEAKRHTRQTDEASKPLQAYREEELQQMWLNFFGADQSYHLARKHFVYKSLLPARERALLDLDGAHHATTADRYETRGYAVLAASQDCERPTSGNSSRRANTRAAILDGRAMSAQIKPQMRSERRRFVEQQKQAPSLVMVRVGDDAASGVYSQTILRLAGEVGIMARPRD